MNDSLNPTDFSALDAEASEMALAQLGGAKNPEGSKGVSAVFFMDARENVTKSLEAGRPIFEEVPFVRVQVRGDNQNIVVSEAFIDKKGRNPNAHNVRFPEQYLRFVAGAKAQSSGTPLSAVPWLSRSQCKELEHFEVRNVEDLAELSDAHGQGFAGFHALKKRAQDFLAAAAGAAPALKLRAELEKRDNELDSLKRQCAEQAQRIDALMARVGDPVPTSAPVAAPAARPLVLDPDEFTRPERGVSKPKRATQRK